MSWVAVAVGGTALVGSVVSAGAAKSAGDKQADAANQAAALQASTTDKTNAILQQQYAQGQANLSPYEQAGGGALAALYQGLGLGSINAQGGSPTNSGAPAGVGTGNTTFNPTTGGTGIGDTAGTGGTTGANGVTNYGASQSQLDAGAGSIGAGYLTSTFKPSDLTIDPSYQFRLNQGEQALQASAAARGGLLTGQGLKDINDYAGQSASQEYAAANDRYNTNRDATYGKLSNLAGLGQSSAAGASANGASAAAGIAGNTQSGVAAQNSLLTSGAAASAAGTVGAANGITGSLNSGLNAWTTLQGTKQPTTTPTNYPTTPTTPVGISNDASNIGAGYAGTDYSISDERLKTDKKKVGKTNSGVDIYTYRIGGGKPTMGVMAQDLEKKNPGAVGMLTNGIRVVNYKKVK